MSLRLGLGMWATIRGGTVAAPANTVPPAIAGTPTEGQTLTASTGTWTGTPTSYSYQWKRGVTNVGSDQNTYVLVAGDVGSTITVTVTATNAGGSTAATSDPTAAIASMYLLRDTFTDVNGTALGSHTMTVGGGWTADAGTWTVQSNQANPATLTGGQAVATADAGAAAGKLTVTIPDTGVATGAVARLVDAANYWLVYAMASGTLRIYEVTAGVFTLRASVATVWVNGDTMSLECRGDVLTATHGADTVSYTSSVRNTATRWGLYAEGVGRRLDTFEVTP